MGDTRQKRQLALAFTYTMSGEAAKSVRKGTESHKAEDQPEHPVATARTMEEICEPRNLKAALRKVKANGGAPGIDAMTVKELPQYLITHWERIRTGLLDGTYRPKPVRRVEIEKTGGGVRLLGIPTVLDRFVQQAVMQVLQWKWEPTFSDHSHGFRREHSAHDAVAEAQQYIAEGHRWVVDVDLEKFFDRVNHDRLMSRLAERENDKRLLGLIRRMLESGVMIDGLVSPTEEGTPQGGPLSPLLSNIVLDELDKELEARGHRFTRYADDCNIYVKSERAGHRVMASVKRFVSNKLRLRINENKSAVARPQRRKFLGFSFTAERKPRRRIAPQALKRFKSRIRELTSRQRGRNINDVVAKLNAYLRGWIGYFGFAQTKSVLNELNAWIRRRLRALIWNQWKTHRRRREMLRRLNIAHDVAWRCAGTRKGVWALSNGAVLRTALPERYFGQLGLVTLATT